MNTRTIASLFKAGQYSTDRGGYPVLREGFAICWFVVEEEAKHYAEYRNTMLARLNTTDVSKYGR